MFLPSTPPPLLAAGPLDRRTLLRLAGVGGLALAGGGWVWKTLRGFGPPARGMQVFDAGELAVLEKYCEALFPGPPETPFTAKEIQVAQFVDLYVSGLYDDTQQLFRMLVRTLNLSTVVGHGAAFQYLSLRRRQGVLRAWSESGLKVRRAANESLSFAANMGYLEDPRVQQAAGLAMGCELSQVVRPSLWPPSRAVVGSR